MIRYILAGLGGGGVIEELPEPEFLIDGRRSFWVSGLQTAFFKINLDGDVGVNFHQLLAQAGLGFELQEILSEGGCLYSVGVGQHPLQRAILSD